MIDIPLFNAPIGESGFNFTPDQFPRWLAYIQPQLETLGGDGAGATGALDADIVGVGRIAGADYFTTDATAPRVPGSIALAVEIPNGKWFVQGHKIEVDEVGGALLLSGVPTGASSYGYVSAREIEETGEWALEVAPENWFATLQPQLSAQGLACLGRVTSDFDGVTALDGARADVIWPLPVIQQRLKDLGGDGGTNPDAGVTPAAFNALKTRVTTLESQIAQILAKLDALGYSNAFPSDTDQLASQLGAVAAGLAEVNPPAIERLQISVVVATAGLGQNDTPNYSPSTGDPLELPLDENAVGGP